MNILVTGGAGFIGSHVVEQLCARNETVTVLDDFNDFYPSAIKHHNLSGVTGRATIVAADIRNAGKLREVFQQTRFDAVIHLAARTGIRPSLTQAQLYTDVNITGTQNLLELAHEFSIKKFIFASSSSVYGLNQRVPFREDDSLAHPISPYAATKLAGEALALSPPVPNGNCLSPVLYRVRFTATSRSCHPQIYPCYSYRSAD